MLDPAFNHNESSQHQLNSIFSSGAMGFVNASNNSLNHNFS